MEGEADGREDHESLFSPHCEVHKERSEPTVGHAISQGPGECGEALTMWERVREQAVEARRRRMAGSGGHLGHTDGMLQVRGWGCSISRLHAMSDVQTKPDLLQEPLLVVLLLLRWCSACSLLEK